MSRGTCPPASSLPLAVFLSIPCTVCQPLPGPGDTVADENSPCHQGACLSSPLLFSLSPSPGQSTGTAREVPSLLLGTVVSGGGVQSRATVPSGKVTGVVRPPEAKADGLCIPKELLRNPFPHPVLCLMVSLGVVATLRSTGLDSSSTFDDPEAEH